jgi:nucleoside-diphosphate-sugar epimerase
MQKILVTGGAGFIGRHMVLSLLNQGFVVRVLDSAPLDFTHENLTIIHGDVRTQDILSSAVAECSAVIHLAGVLGYSDYQINYDVHVDGTKNLITACQKQEVKRIIAYSTFAATRENPAAYGATKKQMEDLLLQSTLNVTIFRPTMVLGDRSKGLTTIIKQSKSYPLFVPMIGSGKATRQPVSVSDIVKLTISTLDNTSSYGKAYNIAGNETINLKIW